MSQKKILIMSAESRKAFDIFQILVHYQQYQIDLCSNANVFYRLILSLIFHRMIKSYFHLEKLCIEYDVVIPVEEEDIEILHEINFRDSLRLPSQSVFENLVDKEKLAQVCDRSNVFYPLTVNLKTYLSELSFIEQKKFDFPVYLKPKRGMGSHGVKKLSDNASLKEYLNEKALIESDYIIQTAAQGSSTIEGTFAVVSEGRILAAYSHRRVLTNPGEGGVSVLSESTNNLEILQYTSKIARDTKYSGFLMIEFKFCSVKQLYCLIEINPRPWGSIALSEVALPGFINSYIDLRVLNRGINVGKSVAWIVPHAFIFIALGRFKDARSIFQANSYIMFCKKSILRSLFFSLFFIFNFTKIRKKVS